MEVRVAFLELVDHAQRLQVVLEAAVFAHALVQRVLAGMAERRVAEVVRQEIASVSVSFSCSARGYRARDLRHFDASA